ncbi:hypothetical protein [Halorussus lipolyticus]|uniref:hypothetical protein n=1 Tax=Halorussus lipolyticus TaxID=3034024 RepID=UPI0023E8284D|nr:hypothetical protein [Halorussus sp. DT80]
MTREHPTTRRAYLRAGGAVAAASALAGCSEVFPGEETTRRPSSTTRTTETPPAETTVPTVEGPALSTRTATEEVDRSQYETIVNVADAGADTSGSEPIDSILNEQVGDDTLLYFPSGRYLLGEWEATGYTNLGVVGEDATLVPPKGKRDYWLMWGDLGDFLFSGFTIDCRRNRVAPVTYLSVSGGTNVVRNVAVRGHRRAPTTAFEVAAAGRGSSLRFENVALPDGSTHGHAVYVFPRSVGELTFRNCRVEHWMEGLYSAYHRGPLRILGGYYANNGIEQVRVGGGTSGALVRGVTVRVDNPRQPKYKPNMRGIWAEEGGKVRIEDCDVAITDLTGTYSSGAIVVGKQFGEAVVTNTEIRTDADAFGLHVRNPIDSMEGQTIPSMGSLPKRTRFTARNVSISGTAESGAAVRANRRDDCRFEDLCIRHPRGARDGVLVAHAEGCGVRNSTIDVTGEAVRAEDTTVETRGVRTNGSC